VAQEWDPRSIPYDVMAILDAIKKRGTFKDYKKAEKAYVEAS
jgi:hypothetical protein